MSHDCPQLDTRYVRRGVSLLEILISIGVVGIGLIGVASLFPLAHYKAEQGVREDRKAIFGRRAFREFFVHELNRPGSMFGSPVAPYWIQNAANPNNIYWNPPPTGSVGIKPQTYCLDPVWVAARQEAVERGEPNSVVSNQFPDLAPVEVQVPRITVLRQKLERFQEMKYTQQVLGGIDPKTAMDTTMAATQMLLTPPRFLRLNQAVEVCRLRDDLVVQEIANPFEGSYAVTPTAGAPSQSAQRQFLREALGGNLLGTKAVANGTFSWMATLSPETAANRYQLSIVVFHRRDLSGLYREEVMAQVEPAVSIMVGPVKQIVIDEITPTPIVAENVGIRHIKAGDWIALLQKPVPAAPPLVPNFIRLKWYQVTAADDVEEDLDVNRELTLSGPDWLPNWNLPLYLVYLRNVSTVYEKTIELQ